jgi:hypothetical protein
MTDKDELAELVAEQKSLEETIRVSRGRISEIRLLVQGDKSTTGLAAKVETTRRAQEWIDTEPDRAAMRATPEWQEWHKQYMEKTHGTR